MPWREGFLVHEIGKINGGRGFQTGKNVFRIGRNTFYDRKNKIPMKNSGVQKVLNRINCRIPRNSKRTYQPSPKATTNTNATAHALAIQRNEYILIRRHWNTSLAMSVDLWGMVNTVIVPNGNDCNADIGNNTTT